MTNQHLDELMASAPFTASPPRGPHSGLRALSPYLAAAAVTLVLTAATCAHLHPASAQDLEVLLALVETAAAHTNSAPTDIENGLTRYFGVSAMSDLKHRQIDEAITYLTSL